MRLRAAHATSSFKALAVKVSNNRGPVVVLVVLVAGAAGVGLWFWLRRRAALSVRAKAKPSEASRRAREATQMYEALDHAMTSVGIGRSPGVPPLKHANELTLGGHPQAQDIEVVTDRYLRARFGNEPLQRDERGALELRIQRVRMKRTESPFRIVR
jgi:hypothetical protein